MLILMKRVPIILKLCQHNWDKPNQDPLLVPTPCVAVAIKNFNNNKALLHVTRGPGDRAGSKAYQIKSQPILYAYPQGN